jgi:hypothetical protein
MIAYQDFTCPKKRFVPFRGIQYESPKTMLDVVNRWIEREQIKVINVETIILQPKVPLGFNPQQIIRVWYEQTG